MSTQPQPIAGAAHARYRERLAGGKGWRVIRPFPSDPGLPTLPEVLAGPGLRTVVGHRPGSRCTVRVEHASEVRYACVVASGHERLHRESVRVWRAWQDGRLGFFVPRPIGFDPRLRTVWEGELMGDPVRPELYGADGTALALRIGYAAGSLAGSGMQPPRISDAACRLTETTCRCLELRRVLPALTPALDELLGKLWTVHATTGERVAWPIHGDLYPGRWLNSELGLGLVDFGRLALGDAELDAATFIAGVDRDDGPPEVCEAFLAGYEEAAGALDHRLVAAYRAQVRLGEMVKAARANRADADGYAEQDLRRILADLGRALS